MTQIWDVTLRLSTLLSGSADFSAYSDFTSSGICDQESSVDTQVWDVTLYISETSLSGSASYSALFSFETYVYASHSASPEFLSTAVFDAVGSKSVEIQSWDVSLWEDTLYRYGNSNFLGTLSFNAQGTAKRWSWYTVSGSVIIEEVSGSCSFGAVGSFSCWGYGSLLPVTVAAAVILEAQKFNPWLSIGLEATDMEIKRYSTPIIYVKQVDVLDRYTEETGITNPSIYYTKAGSQPVLLGSSIWTEVDSTNLPGLYTLELTSGMTNTVGELIVDVSKSGTSAHWTGKYAVVSSVEEDTYVAVTGIPSTLSLEHGPGIWGASAGAGGIKTTIKTVDNNGNGIGNVEVWATSQINGTGVVASGLSDDLGLCDLYLDAGTYYIWRAKTSFTFDNPQTILVS